MNLGDAPDDERNSKVEVPGARKDVFLRNFTSKMLGYALGRGLTLNDGCTVDAIMTTLEANHYSTQTLIREIALSTPFRYREARK